jgi:hypothetical protein
MKRRLLAALFSLCAFLGLGSSTTTGPEWNTAGYFKKGLLLTLSTEEVTNYSFSFIASTKSTYWITVSVCNDLFSEPQNFYDRQLIDLNANQTFRVSGTIDPKQVTIAPYDNKIEVWVLETVDYKRNWHGSCTIDAVSATGKNDCSGSGTLSTRNQYAYFDSNRQLLSCGAEYGYRAPAGPLYNPTYNRLELSDLWFHYENPAISGVGGNLSLRLYDHLDEFPIGTLVSSGGSSYRSFPIKFVPNTLGKTTYYRWTLMGSLNYAVDRRNLRMKPAGEMGPNDFLDSHIYLPAGIGQVGSPYHFKVCLYEMGRAHDFLDFPFTIVRTKEHFGDCVHSDYCVIVGA